MLARSPETFVRPRAVPAMPMQTSVSSISRRILTCSSRRLHVLRFETAPTRCGRHERCPPMLRTSLVASCSGLLLASLVAPRIARADGELSKVRHVVIVMQENHSFDNYFGALAYAPGSPYHAPQAPGV